MVWPVAAMTTAGWSGRVCANPPGYMLGHPNEADSALRDVHEAGEVAAHHLCLIFLRQIRQHVDEAERIGEAFGVRIVRAEQHVVDTDEMHETLRVVLVERVHEHVALEHFDG